MPRQNAHADQATPDSGATRFARVSDADALAMYHDLSIHELGRLAFDRLMQLHPEPYRTYVVDRNINYANVCTAKCIFCNFKADPGDADAYVLSFEQIGRKIEELIDIGGTQILMQGGLVPGIADETGRRPVPRGGEGKTGRRPVPRRGEGKTGRRPVPRRGEGETGRRPVPRRGEGETGRRPVPQGGEGETGRRPVPREHTLPFEWYLDLLRFIRKNYPGIHIHAFSPPEIWAFHEIYRMPLRDVLLRLQEAGLHTIPGGGGEILVDRVRRKIGQGKTLSDEWLEVMRQAHRLGMKTSCTMMMGHIETIEERIEHMRRVRELQDETGGFTAFIHWPFQPEGTKLGRWKHLPRDERDGARRPAPDGEHLLLADAHEYLVWLAVSRLYLDNIPNMQSSWVTMGPKVGQLALFYGANDMGSVMMEENVVSQAGSTFRLGEDEIRRLITDAGWTPQQRDQYYRPISTERRRPATSAVPDAPRQGCDATTPGASSGVGSAAAPGTAFVPLTVSRSR